MAIGKTSQILAYLIQNHPSSITGLMKLAYISDLVSIKKCKKQISDFEYVRYKHGPFDKRIYNLLNELIWDGVVVEKPSYTPRGDEYIMYEYNGDAKVSFNELSPEDIIVLNEVLETLTGYGAKALVDLAYRTKPMEKIGARQDNEVGLNEKLDLLAT